MMECQECEQELESADTSHEYGDCLIYRERMEEREAWHAEAERMMGEAKDEEDKGAEHFCYPQYMCGYMDALIELLKNMEARK